MTAQQPELRGDMRKFAIGWTFEADPDRGAGATPEEAASWGAMTLWAGGRNLCASWHDGQRSERVYWYQLPVIEWLAKHWDALLHEERLPLRNSGDDACRALQESGLGSLGGEGARALRQQQVWSDWWARHCLLAARDGGVLPEVCIRRWRDRIELSWSSKPPTGAPAGLLFAAGDSLERLSLAEVAEPLFQALDEASSLLMRRCPESVRLQRLVARVQAIREPRRTQRLGLLAGLGGDPDTAVARFQDVVNRLSEDVRQRLLGRDSDGSLLVSGHCAAALMFGSVAPDLREEDLLVLAGRLVELHHEPAETAAGAAAWVRPEPLASAAAVPAWRQGYELAQDFLESSVADDGSYIDIEAILGRLNIQVQDVTLRDEGIRAVAIAGPEHHPAVLLNDAAEANATPPGRRFTLAHELCHLLHDQEYGAPLALASGPWAPADLERRANAFAAMLLMPERYLRREVARLDGEIDSSEQVQTLARKLHVSFSAALWHLHNLGMIDERVRDRIQAQAGSMG